MLQRLTGLLRAPTAGMPAGGGRRKGQQPPLGPCPTSNCSARCDWNDSDGCVRDSPTTAANTVRHTGFDEDAMRKNRRPTVFTYYSRIFARILARMLKCSSRLYLSTISRINVYHPADDTAQKHESMHSPPCGAGARAWARARAFNVPGCSHYSAGTFAHERARATLWRSVGPAAT